VKGHVVARADGIRDRSSEVGIKQLLLRSLNLLSLALYFELQINIMLLPYGLLIEGQDSR
jgi:hypothetical protein